MDRVENRNVITFFNHILPFDLLSRQHAARFVIAFKKRIDKILSNPYYGPMHPLVTLICLILLALAINVPFGYLRQSYEKFTFGWYFYVHISIPLIIYLRIKAGFSWKLIPLTLGGAVVGQIIGGLLHRKRHGNR